MNRLNFLAVAAIVMMGITFVSCDSKNSTGSVKLVSQIDSISFMIGQSQGPTFRKQQLEPQPDSWPIKGNLDALIAGFIYGLMNPDDTLLLGKTYMEAGNYVNGIFMQVQEEMAEENKVKAAGTIAEAAKFLAENKGKSDVVTTESGLQYKVITQGKGAKPKADDEVRVNYKGTLLDGSEFDNSEKRGGPAQFRLNGVIPGWTEALQLMPAGSKYTIWVPVELGYYNDPNHPYYGKLLIFEVELLEIVK